MTCVKEFSTLDKPLSVQGVSDDQPLDIGPHHTWWFGTKGVKYMVIRGMSIRRTLQPPPPNMTDHWT